MMWALHYYGLSLVATALFLCLVKGNPYEGWEMYEVSANNDADVSLLLKMEGDYEGANFWMPPVVGLPGTLVLHPDLIERFKHVMTNRGIGFKQLDQDIYRIIQHGRLLVLKGRAPGTGNANNNGESQLIDHENYHNYDKIVSYYQKLADKYPDYVDLHTFNTPTYEGRKMIWLRLHDSLQYRNKPVIMLESAIHSREWISPAATLWAVEHMLDNFNKGEDNATFMMNQFDWIFMPHTNPDGYQYSRKNASTRMYRTNRSVYKLNNQTCTGVDPNRNFDVFWNTSGVARTCNSGTYPGTHAFSEAETRNIKELVEMYKDTIVSYLSVHSYSQYILTPWSYAKNTTKFNTELIRVAKVMADVINQTHGKEFEVGPGWKLLRYEPSGSANDWAQTQLPGTYTYVYELRPLRPDPRGFNLPPNEIIPSGHEFYNSLVVLSKEVNLNLKRFPKIDDLFKGIYDIN